MNDSSLSALIKQIRDNYDVQSKQLLEQFKELEAGISQIEAEIRRMEAERLIFTQQLYKTRRIMQGIENDLLEELLDQVIHYMQASEQKLTYTIGQIVSERETIQQRRQLVISNDPSLERDINDFYQFDSLRETAIKSAPAYYRKVLEDAHERLRDKIQPLLILDDMLRSIPEHLDVQLPIVLSKDPGDGQMFLALPISAFHDDAIDSAAKRVNAVENSIMQSLAFLASDPGWILLEIERSQWMGLRVLTTLCEYSGEESIVQSIENHFSDHIMEYWPFRHISLTIHITWVDWDLWKYGIDQWGDQLGTRAFQPEEVPSNIPSITPSLLFTDKDIISWDRPLRVVEESAWTIQARRLRTLLIRMVAQGRIGKGGLLLDEIWGSLPEPHATSIKTIIHDLLQLNVLRNDEDIITMNSERLVDVQDIINRDITPFWDALVQEPSRDA